ncbi:hypothetical protein KL928_004379 [Ogataea angusta]|uniref:Uncharacterized protein n=1 Tax=Pichia angusta TaxID=870730 RepID=A0AAN6I3Z5_PICAN|nr:uncharacterized protein KL928_004379 [Ogataea angusta]KAG7816915.1 hypothetical protein KL928_004379 [Ogataea angusta]
MKIPAFSRILNVGVDVNDSCFSSVLWNPDMSQLLLKFSKIGSYEEPEKEEAHPYTDDIREDQKISLLIASSESDPRQQMRHC